MLKHFSAHTATFRYPPHYLFDQSIFHAHFPPHFLMIPLSQRLKHLLLSITTFILFPGLPYNSVVYHVHFPTTLIIPISQTLNTNWHTIPCSFSPHTYSSCIPNTQYRLAYNTMFIFLPRTSL